MYVLMDGYKPDIVSKDKDLLQEIMCDDFLELAYYDFYFRMNYMTSKSEEIARIAWEEVLSYFEENIDIFEVNEV